MPLPSTGRPSGAGETGPDLTPPAQAPEVEHRPRALEWVQHATHTLGLAFAVVAFGVLFTALNPNFSNLSNLGNIVSQSTILGIMATGMTFALVAGEIDLSVGSMFALTSMVFGLLLQDGAGVPAAALLAILVGVALGAINGLLSVAFNVPTIIITLGMLNVYAGIALWSNNGLPVSNFASSGWLFHFSDFNFGGPHFISWIPEMAVAWLLVVVIGYLLLTKTQFGLRVLATGSSRTGGAVRGNIVSVSGFGLLRWSVQLPVSLAFSASHSTSLRARGRASYNLTVIAAVIIGGAALNGGRGSVIASALGVLLLGEVNDGLIVAGVDLYGRSWRKERWSCGRRDRSCHQRQHRYVARLRRRLRAHRQLSRSAYLNEGGSTHHA